MKHKGLKVNIFFPIFFISCFVKVLLIVKHLIFNIEPVSIFVTGNFPLIVTDLGFYQSGRSLAFYLLASLFLC